MTELDTSGQMLRVNESDETYRSVEERIQNELFIILDMLICGQFWKLQRQN